MDGWMDGRMDGYMDAFAMAYTLFQPFLATKVIEDPVWIQQTLSSPSSWR